MHIALALGPSQTLALTASPASISADPSRERLFRIVSDQPFHVSTNASATTTDAFVPALTPTLIAVAPTLALSVVKAAAATSNGSVWATEVKRV